MHEFMTSVLSALEVGAVAKLNGVASEAVLDSYHGLKKLLIEKLGDHEVVQDVEDSPNSEGASAALVREITRQNLRSDKGIEEFARRIHEQMSAVETLEPAQGGAIDIAHIRGHVNAIVENLTAEGNIRVGEIVAESGDARISGLAARSIRKN